MDRKENLVDAMQTCIIEFSCLYNNLFIVNIFEDLLISPVLIVIALAIET